MNKDAISIKTVGLSLIALLLSLEFVFFPWLDWLDEKKQELNNVKAFVNKQERALDSKDNLTSYLEEFSKHLGEIDKIPTLEKNQDPALFWLTAVDSVVAKYEVNVDNKAPQREVAINDTYAVYTGRLNISGEANLILNLIYELENIEQGNRVRQISMFRDKAQPDLIRANIEFIRVFKRQ